MSNEIYVDLDGINWEGKGIAPDVPVVVFDTEDPIAGHRQAIEHLIAKIDKKIAESREANDGN